MSGLRSGVGLTQKATSTGQVLFAVRPRRSGTSDMYPKEAEGEIRCSICHGWGYASHQCRVKCARCGKTGHATYSCWDRKNKVRKLRAKWRFLRWT